MATFTLTGNSAQLNRLAHTIKAVCSTCTDNKNVSFTLDDSDFSVTYTDGNYGSKKQGHK